MLESYTSAGLGTIIFTYIEEHAYVCYKPLDLYPIQFIIAGEGI